MRILAVLASLTLALFSTAQAAAAVVLVEFNGTILTGNDTSGHFTGMAGANLTDQTISGLLSYDPDLAESVAPGEFASAIPTNAWLGLKLTIGLQDYVYGSIDGTGSDSQRASVFRDPDELNFVYERDGFQGTELASLQFGDFATPFLSGSNLPGGSQALPANFLYVGEGGFGSFLIQRDQIQADALFSITMAQAAGGGVVGAVPEPEAWAMLILGFLAVGAVLRRQGRATARSAAVAPLV